ncbi:hypothetical protein AVEN_172363-1 [Araneus ventricosus]|uniref:Uncharacterized protein n=1 Tax=Araneus ventricosus TaxID=182803 RepID=A0A4Y2VX49_ARAVE|nr:hypothetical protein AVEN_172363-1 [Araneus ventricosus]
MLFLGSYSANHVGSHRNDGAAEASKTKPCIVKAVVSYPDLSVILKSQMNVLWQNTWGNQVNKLKCTQPSAEGFRSCLNRFPSTKLTGLRVGYAVLHTQTFVT